MHPPPRQNNTFTGLSGGYEGLFAAPHRFSFNGMEKDDELKGLGNSLDFGARVYDSRLGRWLSLDPLMYDYPFLSPYHALGNSPIVIIDKEGKENIIYLVDLRLQDPKLSKSERKAIENNLKEIAKAANRGFKEKGLSQRVVVISPSEIPTADKLDKSDVLATIGTKAQLLSFDENNANHARSKNREDYDIVGVVGMGPERSTAIGLYGGDKGDRIAVDIDQVNSKNYGANHFGLTPNEYTAWLLQHGSGHNAGICHSDVQDCSQPTGGETRDLMTSANFAEKERSRWKTYRDKVGPKLRSLFFREKFTKRNAKDNIYNKEIK